MESLKPSKYYKPRHERDLDTQVDYREYQPDTPEIHDTTDINIQEIHDNSLNPVHSENETCSGNMEQNSRDSYLNPIHRQSDTLRPADTKGDIHTQTQLRDNINPGFSGEMTENTPPPCLPSINAPPPSPNIIDEIVTDTV